jgi:hypothetical protein
MSWMLAIALLFAPQALQRPTEPPVDAVGTPWQRVEEAQALLYVKACPVCNADSAYLLWESSSVDEYPLMLIGLEEHYHDYAYLERAWICECLAHEWTEEWDNGPCWCGWRRS